MHALGDQLGKARLRNKGGVAVIGYGSQGRALALNLRDSGYRVIVGVRSRSKSRRIAKRDGIAEIMTVSNAVAGADIVAFAFPDHLHGRVFTRVIAPNLKKNATLLLLHGTSVHFGFVAPPDDCDVILVAPHAPGVAVREAYLGDQQISAFYSVYQNRSRKAAQTAFAMAKAAGFKRKNLIKTTFEHEAVGDLFGEQAVLCGGLAMLIKTGFEVLVERGLKPENAYLEVAYQLDLIIDLIKRYGIEGMFSRISVAARYGSLKAGPEIINAGTKKRMERLASRIESGKFPNELDCLSDEDIAELNKSLRDLTDPRLERAARKFARSKK